jgi:hypothetical protein
MISMLIIQLCVKYNLLVFLFLQFFIFHSFIIVKTKFKNKSKYIELEQNLKFKT